MNKMVRMEKWLAPDRFPIRVRGPGLQPELALHTHAFMELVIIIGGVGMHVMEREAWPIGAGDVFVIRANQAHGYRDVNGLALINVLYDPDRLAMPIRDLRVLSGYHALFTLEPMYRKRHRFESRLKLTSDQLSRVQGMAQDMADELTRAEGGYRFMTMALFMQLVGYLARSYKQLSEPATAALLRVGETIGYLERHYADGHITLDTLAKMAHMSKRNLLRVFSEGVGASPIDYLIRVRVNKAAELLREGKLSITEIAYAVGFQDGNYFSRQFRRVMGVSPRHY